MNDNFLVEAVEMQFIIPLKRDDLLEPADQANAYVVENLLDVNEVDELKLQGLHQKSDETASVTPIISIKICIFLIQNWKILIKIYKIYKEQQ